MVDIHEDLEHLPEAVQSGKLSVGNALGKLAEVVCVMPEFKTITNDEDLTGEVIVNLLQHGHYLFSRYDRKFGKFTPYFASYVRFLYKTAQREKTKEAFNAACLTLAEHENYAQNEERYFQDEYCYRGLRFKPYFPLRTDKPPYRSKSKIFSAHKENSMCGINADCTEGGENNEAKERKSAVSRYCTEKHGTEKKIALVVSLKSCYYVDDEHIEAVSDFCEIPKEDLTDTVETLKLSLRPKIERLETLKNRRDRSYYLHRRYRLRLDYCKTDAQNIAKLRELYEFHTKKWQEKNALLQEKGYAVCPSNKVLAGVLGICERQIGYFLNKAERLEILFKKER
ncbi:MAG: hypothetical protein ACTTKL_10340 [Treponema sp.]